MLIRLLCPVLKLYWLVFVYTITTNVDNGTVVMAKFAAEFEVHCVLGYLIVFTTNTQGLFKIWSHLSTVQTNKPKCSQKFTGGISSRRSSRHRYLILCQSTTGTITFFQQLLCNVTFCQLIIVLKKADFSSVYFAHSEYVDYINCYKNDVSNKQHKQGFEFLSHNELQR